ncbi:MAG: protein-disulfide reductase DsbD N-terminal domain-containing protein [Pyrinomonadaceae bacterium]
MKRTILVLSTSLLLISAAACAGSSPVGNQAANTGPASATPADAKINLKELVRASAAPVALKAGGQAEAEVRLSIADGYHINANPPTYPYLKATEIEVVPEQGLSAGEPSYPLALRKKFAFAEDQLAVYEHEAVVKVPLRAEGSARAGARTLRAKVRVQACDEEKCFPPTSFETTIPVTIN